MAVIDRLKKKLVEIYLKIINKLSRGRGYGKKYRIINSTVNKIETTLKSDTADVWAGRMHLHPNDGLRLSIRGVHDIDNTEILMNHVKKDQIVIDLGAHIGYYTLMMAKLVGPNGKVFAFEPEPRNLELLQKNISKNGYENVIVVPKAVSNNEENCILYVGQESFGANKIFKPKKTNVQKFKEIKTQTIKLDNYFKENSFLEKISFLKMDIEGSEIKALEGMKKILESNQELMIFTEINKDALEDSGSDYKKMLKYLEGFNFRFYIQDKDDGLKNVKIDDIDELLEDDIMINIFCKKV
jgi:FkbM family methyltransferase